MANNPVIVKKITNEKRQMLIDGRAKIVFTGHLVDEGADQKPISVYVSDKDDLKSSDKCPLIFRIQFLNGAARANRVDFLYRDTKDTKETVADGKDMETTFTKGEDFKIVLHVELKTLQPVVNDYILDITPDRPIGYDEANFLFVTGNGMENSSIDILSEDFPCGKTKK